MAKKVESEVEVAAENESKRARRVSKTVEDDRVVIKVVGVDNWELNAKVSDLPEDVVSKLPAVALSHILGDAAAGKEGQEAVDKIQKKWDALVAGHFSVRKPAEKKVKVSDLLAAINDMEGVDAEKAKAALAALGITM